MFCSGRTLSQSAPPPSPFCPVLTPPPPLPVSVLLGEDSETVRAAARYLAEQLATRKQLIVTLALRQPTPALLKQIVPLLKEKRKEADR